jgi:two-component system NtrC family sensor kinase
MALKKLIIILFFAGSIQMPSAQTSQSVYGRTTIDSLKYELGTTQNDTLRLVLFAQLRYNYFFINTNLDSAMFYSKQVLSLTQKLKYKIDEAYAWDMIGDIMNLQNNESTLETFFKGVKIAEESGIENKILPRTYLERMIYWENNFNASLIEAGWSPRYFRLKILASLYQDLGHAYGNIMANQQKLFFYLSKAIDIHKSYKDTLPLVNDYNTLAEYFRSTNQFDSCLIYALKCYKLQMQKSDVFKDSWPLAVIGTMYFKKGNYSAAINMLRQAIQINNTYSSSGKGLAYFTLSEYFLKKGIIDSSLFYARNAYAEVPYSTLSDLQNINLLLARLYKTIGESDSALKYYESSSALNDSINNADKRRKLQGQDFDEQIHQQEVQDAKIEFKNQIKVYTLLVGLSAAAIIALILLRNNRHKQKANIKLEKAYQELKSTQAQLIQSEKMASLGELTAGIAHEIQNPLNFVNNFSEVSNELIGEMVDEVDKGNTEDVKAIAQDVKQNLEKILHHGKRADSIVKGMLQHSRVSTGHKELTDINALADEYLRLSYHGMRAKDKNFNATFQTDFDDTIRKINIVPQDIGRVLLNLFNNAFYAVQQKKNPTGFQNLSGLNNYEPTVFVCTKKVDSKVEIHVKDNGIGIPQKVVDKIFQPFFTTKPTGQGTGLGLSLSYDIIKAHGGEIRVETKEGEGAEFVIQLPIV